MTMKNAPVGILWRAAVTDGSPRPVFAICLTGRTQTDRRNLVAMDLGLLVAYCIGALVAYRISPVNGLDGSAPIRRGMRPAR
jgi:hypothetical protein